VVQLPTNSNSDLGNRNWGLGASAVVLHLEKGDPWVYGVLVNNIWSLSDNKQGGSYNNGLIQPFVNYNFDGGFYITSAPDHHRDWKAESSQRWTVPVGGGVGKIFHLGKLPVNTQLSAYYNVVKPDYGANWQIRRRCSSCSRSKTGAATPRVRMLLHPPDTRPCMPPATTFLVTPSASQTPTASAR
jgi:hypothetical protein